MVHTADYVYYNGELYHASDKKTQHKYIKKVKVNGKWRYYYKDKENKNSKYGTYTDKEGLDTYTVKKSNKWFSSTKTTTKNKVYRNNKAEGKDTVYYEGRLTRTISRLKKKTDKILKKIESNKGSSKFLKKGAKIVSKMLSKFDNKESTTIPKKHKYIQRIKSASGKYIYFYTQEEYDRYLTKQKYQKNEPSFMKKVPELTNRSSTVEDDMSEINEKYSPYDKARSENCANCTVAYELRCRGYDVQAAARVYGDDDYYAGSIKGRLAGLYENADTIDLKENGERDRVEGFLNKFGRTKGNNKNYDADTVEKAILKHSGKNTRGDISVEWKTGSAHSMVYEVDKKGKITIRDCQTNNTYSVGEITKLVKNIEITRTDNLKLKKSVLKCVENNTTEVRDYELEDWKVKRVNNDESGIIWG